MRGRQGVPPRGQALVNRATRWLGPAGFDPSRLRPSACALRLPVLLAGSGLFAQNVCRYFGSEGVQPKGAFVPWHLYRSPPADSHIRRIGRFMYKIHRLVPFRAVRYDRLRLSAKVLVGLKKRSLYPRFTRAIAFRSSRLIASDKTPSAATFSWYFLDE